MGGTNKIIQSVEVDTKNVLKSNPPKYTVTISYRSGIEDEIPMYGKDIAKNYWEFLDEKDQKIFSLYRNQREDAFFAPEPNKKPQANADAKCGPASCVIL